MDDTFPEEAPVRQWVLSLPMQIRYRLAYDGKLLSAVLRVFLRVVNAWYRKQGQLNGIRDSFGGSVTFAQRFGSALNLMLNPHFHSILLDGVFNQRNGVFHEAPPLQDEDVKGIVETTAHRVIRLLERRGVNRRIAFSGLHYWRALIHCGGKMRMVAALTDPASIKKYLDGVGLPSSAPEIAPVRPPPQAEFEYY